MNKFCCTEEKPEGLDEVIELWREFKQETTVGPCNAPAGESESSEAANGEKTVV